MGISGDDIISTIIGRLISELIIKGSPRVYRKLAEDYSHSRLKDPWYKWLVIDNIFIACLCIIVSCFSFGWIAGVYPFDGASLIAISLFLPLFGLSLWKRSVDKGEYEVHSLMTAIREGKITFDHLKPKDSL